MKQTTLLAALLNTACGLDTKSDSGDTWTDPDPDPDTGRHLPNIIGLRQSPATPNQQQSRN
ncbi:MAG: hypothetical protein ACI8RZ_001920 [Myxococcota bacterium]|jgi:hypothetical protein